MVSRLEPVQVIRQQMTWRQTPRSIPSAMMVDLPIITYYVLGAGPGGQADPALKAIGKPLFPDIYVVGFNKSNHNASTLLPEINQALAVLKKNGTLKTIYQKWSMWNDQQAAIGIM